MNHRLVSVQDRRRGAINGAQRLALVGSPVIQPRIICSGYPPSFFHPVCRPSGPLGFCFALLPRPSTPAEGVPALRAYPIGGKRIPRRCVSTASESDGTRSTRPLCKLQGVASARSYARANSKAKGSGSQRNSSIPSNRDIDEVAFLVIGKC